MGSTSTSTVEVFTAGYELPGLGGASLAKASILTAGELRWAGAGSLEGDLIGAEVLSMLTREGCLRRLVMAIETADVIVHYLFLGFLLLFGNDVNILYRVSLSM